MHNNESNDALLLFFCVYVNQTSELQYRGDVPSVEQAKGIKSFSDRIEIIIILQLRSRRLQDFSRHFYLGQLWQSGQPTSRVHHTQHMIDVRYEGCTRTPRSPFAMWWNVESITSVKLILKKSKDAP